MTYIAMGPGALDYLPCRYGTSKLLFRGPRRKLDRPYIAFVGGTETYGRFIEKPFSKLVEDETGQQCVNFGCMNAGIDVFSRDPYIPMATAGAMITVVQVMGAQNMTNRFYSVHPRRNDRFVAPSDLLKTIYREIDFSEFHFNKHMLTTLKKCPRTGLKRSIKNCNLRGLPECGCWWGRCEARSYCYGLPITPRARAYFPVMDLGRTRCL